MNGQLPSIVREPTNACYPSYKFPDREIGDDLAAVAAVWGLVTRGVYQAPGGVLTRTTARDKLLGMTT